MRSRIVLQLNPTPHNARNSEATFVTLQSGRILLAWSKFTGGSDSDFGAGVIAARWSDDGGLTWSGRDRILVARADATNVMSPSLLRLQDGRIALLYLRKDGDARCTPYIRFSCDEAETWSRPLQIIPIPGYYVINNDRLIQLRGGRLVAPVGLHRYRMPWAVQPLRTLPGDEHTHLPAPREPFLGNPALIMHYFSDDGGQTWFESRNNIYYCHPAGWGLEEPGVIELRDGRLWSWARSGEIERGRTRYRQWQAFSRDRGLTWSAPAPSRFVSPCSPMQVKRMPATGDLLAVWNDHSRRFKVPPPKPISWGRTPLACAISADDGRTWRHHRLLETAPDHGFCYPAIHFTAQAVLLAYNAGGATSHKPLDTQRVRWIPLEELYK